MTGNTASDTVTLTIEQRHFAIFEGVDRSRPGADDEPFRALYRVDLEGGDPAVLHPYLRSEEITGFRISPTGEYVAFNLLRNDDFNLYVVTTDGGDAKMIDSGGYLDQNWRWSPTGKQLAYLAAHTCNCAEEMEGIGNSTSATSVSTGLPVGDIGMIGFQWSPYCGAIEISPFGTDRCNGNQIAYIADEESTGQYELFISPLDGYPSWRVSGDLIPEGDVSAFQWAPGGKRIAYLANRRYIDIPELFVTDNGGSIDYLVTRPPGSDSTGGGRVEAFCWAPNGTRIGFLISHGVAPDAPLELRTVLWDGSDNNSVTTTLPPYGTFPISRITMGPTSAGSCGHPPAATSLSPSMPPARPMMSCSLPPLTATLPASPMKN